MSPDTKHASYLQSLSGNCCHKGYNKKHCYCRTVRCLAHVSIMGGEKTSLNRKLLLYMLQVTQRISSAAQPYRFQLILISTDVASLSQETGSFLCKLKLLDQGRDGWKLWNGQNDTHRSLQVTVSMMLQSFINACNTLRWWFVSGEFINKNN